MGSRLLGALPRFEVGSSVERGFPALKTAFLLSTQICGHAQAVLSIIPGYGSEKSGLLDGLDSALQSTLTSWLHCNLFAVLSCAYFQGLEQRCLPQKSAVLHLHGCPPNNFFFLMSNFYELGYSANSSCVVFTKGS